MEKKRKVMYSSIIAEEEEHDSQKEHSENECGKWEKEKYQIENHYIVFRTPANINASYFFINGELSQPFISYITPPPKVS